MSSKPKALLKHSKSKHKKEQTFNTADDYQAAGVDFEDAAGKWRAGDAVKSMRFFQKALEVYEQGLQKFPANFDLAYNKARVELEIATHPILVKQLQQPVLTILRTALESHRYALSLDPDNADTLFNTAQVLTSIAEEYSKSEMLADADAIQCLEEALELLDRCSSLQELKYDENLEQQERLAQHTQTPFENADDDEEDGGVSVSASKDKEEQWFSIVEPVTRDTLIDTALAQLGTLTTLCGMLSNSASPIQQSMLAWIEEYSARILNKKMPMLVKDSIDRLQEIALVKVNFVSALLEAGFRAGGLDLTTFKRERDAAFAVSELDLERSADALVANARSLISFNSALTDRPQEDDAGSKTVRWNSLSAAIANLVAASKITEIEVEELSRTHLLRGDCSLLQYCMGLPPINYQTAVKNAGQLLKNTEVFYKNAGRLTSDIEEKATAGFRYAVSQYLDKRDRAVLVQATQGREDAWAVEQLEDMISEGLLPVGFQIN